VLCRTRRRAVVVGTQTFGKGSVQTVFPLDGNTGMRLTTAKYYTPSGRSIQNVGISRTWRSSSPTIKEPKNGEAAHVVVREKDSSVTEERVGQGPEKKPHAPAGKRNS